MHYWWWIGALCVVLCGSSCFEIREEIDLQEDGSGYITLTLDFAQSKEQLREYWAAGQINGYRLPSEQDIHNLFRIVRNSIELTKGMGEASYTLDFDNFVGSVRAHFPDIHTLNEALTAVSQNLDWLYVPTFNQANYDFQGNEFHRCYPLAEPVTDFSYNDLPFMARFMLETTRLVGIYRFSQPIRQVSNPRAEIAPSQKAVRIELLLSELVQGQSTLDNCIILEPK